MTLRVLMIDDSRADQELARRALRALPTPPGPVDLVWADDWQTARPMLAAGSFDLVLLDYRLPGTSGLDVLRDIAANGPHPHPPILMTTGQSDVGTAVETIRAGAWDYVPKSLDWGPALRLAVERVLERARLEREVADARLQLETYAQRLEQRVASRTAMVHAQAAEIEALYLEAEESARAKEEIVSNLSHELRTPLNAIVGFTSLLLDDLAHDERPTVHDMLAKVRGNADELLRLVESLLLLSDLRTGSAGVHATRFSLADLVSELRTDAEILQGEKGLELVFEAKDAPCEVENDREKVRTIAYHLLSNAIKFTPAGTVHLSASSGAHGEIRLRIADTGIGLPAEAKAIVFDDFRQLDGSTTRSYGGLGIGLGIVKRYVGLLGGTIQPASTAGEGTAMHVILPARRAEDPGERRAGTPSFPRRSPLAPPRRRPPDLLDRLPSGRRRV